MLIVLTICSILTTDCRDETMNLDAHEMTPPACQSVAQAAIADFMQAFPNYRPTRFKCIPANRREHNI
ncbi:MAG: hypothetical protein EOP84_27830 [Verrucomicrobiaceae bacterium]|nr:MAG: hypothetical protein EOP84_27830 [Verrucomicrobiaceae bacterium]